MLGSFLRVSQASDSVRIFATTCRLLSMPDGRLSLLVQGRNVTDTQTSFLSASFTEADSTPMTTSHRQTAKHAQKRFQGTRVSESRGCLPHPLKMTVTMAEQLFQCRAFVTGHSVVRFRTRKTMSQEFQHPSRNHRNSPTNPHPSLLHFEGLTQAIRNAGFLARLSKIFRWT